MSEKGIEKKPFEVRLTVENTIKLDPKNPIPIEYGGNSFYLVKGKKYLPFLGREDNFPAVLLEARLISTTQNACITSIASSTIGKGLKITTTGTVNEDLSKWLKSVNNHRMSFNKMMTNIVDGERAFGNQFVEVARGELNGKKFIKLYIHSMLYCRLKEPENGEFPEAVIISKDFIRNGYYKPKDTVTIPLWSPNKLDQEKCWVKASDGTFRTMLHFKNEVSGVEHYGLPASISSLRDQVLEGKYTQFDLDNLDNNMILGGMLILKSAMTKEEAQAQAKEILLSHVGQGKTGRIAVVSSESGLADVEFTPYETSREGSFLESSKKCERKILTSHSWDSMLASIDIDGALGKGSSYIRGIWDLAESKLLKPLRQDLISEVVQPIMDIYSEWFGVKEMEKYEYDFESDMPYSFMSDIKPETFMKVKEARALAKLEADDKNGEKYLSEMKPASNVQTKSTSEEGTDND